MTKKIELHFPLKVSDSSYYKNLIDYPPEGFEYVSTAKSGLIGNTFKRGTFRFVKSAIRRIFSSFSVSVPLYAKQTKFSPEFIHHFAHCIPKKSNGINFFLDIEGAWQLGIGELTPSSKKKISKILSQDNCKAILPWTFFSRDGFVKEFPELEHKVEVIRPAVPLMQTTKRVIDDENFIMLFVARDFELKNGEYAAELMDSFIKNYKGNVKIQGVVVGTVSNKIKNKYPNLHYFDLMPKEQLYKYYKMADVFVYPSPVDTFGFSIIEAMSFGTPTIAMKTFGTKSVHEIIVNGFNGMYFSEEDYTEGFVRTITSLIEDREIWGLMSDNCLSTILYGPYSIKHRNKMLEGVLEKCMKK